MRVRTSFFVTAWLLLVASLAGGQTFPKPVGRVNDFAGVIDPDTAAAIDRRLDDLERATSHEIAVATVKSLDGMSVEEYANKLFKSWGVGQKQSNNGVLVIVAVDDHKMRIEVGYGLEGILPDGLAGQVVREEFTPRFKEGDYSGGIRQGVARLADIVEKEHVLTPEELAAFNESNDADQPPFWILIPFFGVFVTIGFGMLGAGLSTKTIFPLLFGSLFGGMPLALSLAFMGWVSVFTLVPWSAIVLIGGFRLGRRPSWQAQFRNEGKGLHGGPVGAWKMGGSNSGSGGSSGSSGASGSSSSFGGGSSGGGGASGSW